MSIKIFNNDDIDRIVNNPECVYYIHRFDVGGAFYDPVEKRFYAYFTKKDIDELRKGFFDIVEYHNEGGKEQKNWHVLTLRKIKKGEL